MEPTRVLHLDVDAFFAQVEQVRNPELAGRPVAVGSGVVASASYEARNLGVTKGMPLTRARRLVPELVILEGQYSVYRCFTERVFEVARLYAPPLESYLDEGYFDLTGTEALYGADFERGEPSLRESIRRATGLGVTLGVAANRMLAKLAGGERKPDGYGVVPAGEEERFLDGRPVEDVAGIGRRRAEMLARLNVRTVDELRLLGPDDLSALFGAMGRLIYHRARGRDPAPVETSRAPRTISRETSFHRDTIERREVEGMLHYLIERAMRAARQLGLAARTIEICVGLAAGEHRRRARTIASPTTSDAAAYAVALILLGEIWPRRDRLHRVGVTLSNFAPAGALQSDLFAGGRRDEPEYYRGLDRVRDRFGHAAVVAGRSLELLGRLEQDRYGFVLRTPSLTK